MHSVLYASLLIVADWPTKVDPAVSPLERSVPLDAKLRSEQISDKSLELDVAEYRVNRPGVSGDFGLRTSRGGSVQAKHHTLAVAGCSVGRCRSFGDCR